nr:hypothetical protein [Tanacetum cinerariifolium]
MCDVLDDNNFFIFDEESVRISLVSKMPFRKKPYDSMNVQYSYCKTVLTEPEDQTMALQPHSSGIKIQDLMLNYQRYIQDESSNSETRSSSVDDKISKIAKRLKRIEKANQKNKDFENQNKDLQDKYYVLKNQATIFEMNNKELNEQLKVLIEKIDDLLAQTNVLKDQFQVKHVMIDTHVECQEKYAKLKDERYEYMIRYSAYFDNDKQHRKQIADQEVLYDKMSVQMVKLDKHVRDLKNAALEKDFKISKLEECVRNKDLEIEKCLERLNVCENKLHKMGQTNQTVHMIMPSKDLYIMVGKQIADQEVLYDKMSVQMVKLDKHVRDLKNAA